MSSATGHAIGSGAFQSPWRSPPENTATTPSAARAFDRSTPAMRAWACGLRTTAIQTIPGTVRSSTNRACPVRSRASSLRGAGAPMPVATCPVTVIATSSDGSSLPHGLDDVDVAGAAAEVALEPLPDLLLARVGVLAQEADGGHHHSRRAVAALQRMLLVKRLLHRVHRAVLG